jgi:ribonucleotide reductase alpha subunit
MGEHLGDVFVTDRLVADSGSMGRGHDQVRIADRVTAAAIGTGDHDTTAAAEKTHQCFRFGFRDGDPEALFGHGLFQRRLRPRGTPAKGAGNIASGAVSIMHIWDAMCGTILSTGARRGAILRTMP